MDHIDTTILSFALVFLRVGTFFALLPTIGEQILSTRVKLFVALGVSSLVVFVTDATPTPTTPLGFAHFAVIEGLVGLFLGLLVRLFLLGLQMAGSIAAQATSLSQLLGGATPDPIPAMGYIWVFAGLALASLLGLHGKAVTYIAASYAVFPVGVMPEARFVYAVGTDQVMSVFVMAMAFSAPFYAVSLLYNLTLGVLNRAMPQLMVAFVGAPLITWASLVLLLAGSAGVVSLWVDLLGAHLDSFKSVHHL